MRQWQTKQATPRLAHNFAAQQIAIPWLSVDMVCDLRVSPIVPPLRGVGSTSRRPEKRYACGTSRESGASPSLKWVPWASVPHLPGQIILPSGHRYYDPLRMPKVRLRFVRSSLSSPDTLHCSLYSCFLTSKAECRTRWEA